MDFLTDLFLGSENSMMVGVLALGIVLVLIVFSVWILKFLFRASNNLGRAANKRLSVVDTIAVDAKRQLMIVRRDNVEHLILTGGPQDLIVESDIPVERLSPVAARRRGMTPPPPPPASEPLPTPSRITEPLPSVSSPVARALEDKKPAEPPREPARPVAAPPRRTGSLRYTGLMRSINQSEPAAVIPINPDNSEHRRIDSAKTGPANDTSGQARLGGGNQLGDGATAEGN